MTKTEATHQATQKINEILRDCLKARQPVLFLVSGGSALNLLAEIDLETITLLASSLTIGVLDERYSLDPSINNFHQFMQTRLYADAIETGAVFIDTRLEEFEPIEQLAARFEQALKDWSQENPTGKIVITQGMGPDGHTSGIMPFPENPVLFAELFDSKNWVTSYDAGSKNQFPLRVTTTITFLKKVDYSVFFVCGEDKKDALEKVTAATGSLAVTPARIIKQMKKVEMFSDQKLLHSSYSRFTAQI